MIALAIMSIFNVGIEKLYQKICEIIEHNWYRASARAQPNHYNIKRLHHTL